MRKRKADNGTDMIRNGNKTIILQRDGGCIIALAVDGSSVSSVLVYSEKTSMLTGVGTIKGMDIALEARISSSSLEKILTGKSRAYVMNTDDSASSMILGAMLSCNDHRYIISTGRIPGVLNGEGEIVEGMKKAFVMTDYLALFGKDACVIVSGLNPLGLRDLLSNSSIRCIAIVSEGCSSGCLASCLPRDTALIDIISIDTELYAHDNSVSRMKILNIIDSCGIRADRKILAYLLNDIDDTDSLETVREISEKHMNCSRLYGIDSLYGTEILRNAISQQACIYIIRYLVRMGFRYNPHPSDEHDISRMVLELYSSPELGKIFAVMMEQGYSVSAEEIFAFMDNLISWAKLNGEYLTLIEDSHTPSYYMRLDEIRCMQFRYISPYIADSVFYMRDACGNSLLHIAARELEYFPRFFSMILERSAEVINAKNEDGFVPLHYITDSARWDAIIAAGADTGIRDPGGSIPKLHVRKEAVDELLSKRNPAESDRILAERMLFHILDDCYGADKTYEYMDRIMRLLDIISAEARQEDTGYTPLMAIIIQEGYFPEIYDKMLSIGININARCDDGNNALRLAVLSPECTAAKIRYLIDHGADASVCTLLRGTIANIAASLFHIRSEEWNAMWLYEDKSIFTYSDERTESPLMIAIRHQNMDAISFLMSHGAALHENKAELLDRIRKLRSNKLRTDVSGFFLDAFSDLE